MPKKFIKKPMAVEAVRWTGDNFKEIRDFVAPHIDSDNASFYKNTFVKSLEEGRVIADIGDWIVKDERNDFFPMRPDIFARKYYSEQQYAELCDG